jgi:hypothetical protein
MTVTCLYFGGILNPSNGLNDSKYGQRLIFECFKRHGPSEWLVFKKRVLMREVSAFIVTKTQNAPRTLMQALNARTRNPYLATRLKIHIHISSLASISSHLSSNDPIKNTTIRRTQQSCLHQAIAGSAALSLPLQDDHRSETQMPLQAAHQILQPPNFRMKQLPRRAE